MSLQILTVAQAREADQAAAAEGLGPERLVQRAGKAIADAVIERWTLRPVAVLCGPGLNGADGYVAARLLAEQGWPVRILATLPQAPAIQAARAEWQGPVDCVGPDRLGDAELVIDALFGAGLTRPLAAEPLATLRAAESRGLLLVAADLPSGLAGDTGKPLGYAPAVTLTVTFHRKKPAHLLLPGRSLCGEVFLVDIGIPDAHAPALLWENAPELWLARFPWPKVEVHKHARGRLVVVSGHALSTGAARMAARAGLRVGAGVVTLCSPQATALAHAPHLEAVMLQAFEDEDDLAQRAKDADAVLIGPAAGVDAATSANVMALARTGAALVLDADALTVFRDDRDRLYDLLDRDDVLTPHPGEFERIFPGLLAASPDRVSATRQAAQIAGAVVLLKGPDTVIAAPDGRAAINANGAPWLATAGSGDVLAGVIGGLLAQGMDSFDAACAGVWIHAEAGARFGPGLIAEDLPEQLPQVLSALWRMRLATNGQGFPHA